MFLFYIRLSVLYIYAGLLVSGGRDGSVKVCKIYYCMCLAFLLSQFIFYSLVSCRAMKGLLVALIFMLVESDVRGS